jgi:GMP synthase-like glutamine amidotransferase
MKVLVADNTLRRTDGRTEDACTRRLIGRLTRVACVFVVRTRAEARAVLDVERIDAIVLSGSSQTFSKCTVQPETLALDVYLLRQPLPVLGVCFGMQTMAVVDGGRVRAMRETVREWSCGRFFWHADEVVVVPPGYTARRRKNVVVSLRRDEDPFRYGVQHHPEASSVAWTLFWFLRRIAPTDVRLLRLLSPV